MNFLKFNLILLFVFNLSVLNAQSDFNRFEARPIMSLSFNVDPFSINSVGKEFDLPKVDFSTNRFAKRPEVDMVAAANRKAYRAQQQQEQSFSFVERQSAIFSAFKPKFDNSSSSPLAPSYHQQPIYSGLNRVKNSAYKDLGDQFGRMSPFYQFSPYRRNSAPIFYFSR